MSDIMFSMAWQCGDKDCKVQWHQSNYWCYSKGDGDSPYSVDTYGDGDHEDIDEEDLPTGGEIEMSWIEYSRHVAATGEDPLGEFYVNKSVKVREAWRFRFAPSILGVVVTKAQRNKKDYDVRNLPQHVAEYLRLKPKSNVLYDFPKWEDFASAVEGVKPNVWFKDHIERHVSRNPETVKGELIALAKRHLARKGMT